MRIWIHLLVCGVLLHSWCSGQGAPGPMPAPVVVSDARGLANALATGRVANIELNGALLYPHLRVRRH
jgi:hypothetical protein